MQVSLLRRPPGHEAPHPVVVDFVHASYFRSDAGGVTVAGLIDPAEAKNIVDPDNYRKQTDFEFVSDLGERLTKRYPALKHSEILEGFASLYAVTPDWHPIMDEIPPASGFFQCSGFSGHGFKLAPAVGVMTVDMITGTPDSGLDYRAFRLSRFEEGKAIHGRYEFSILG
ncbi:MAG: FAD-binding oxidoreductase [Bacteroidetes bacterium]|nr:FAD-binding oxidoreductase [Bacteroidota bacterium]